MADSESQLLVSVMQSDRNCFYGNVVLNSLNMAFSDEDIKKEGIKNGRFIYLPFLYIKEMNN